MTSKADIKKQKKIDHLRSKVKNIHQVKNPISLLLSAWVFPLVRLARKSTIFPEHLPDVSPAHDVKIVSKKFQVMYDNHHAKNKDPGLVSVFSQCKEFYFTFFLQLFNIIYNLYTPFVVEQIALFVEVYCSPLNPERSTAWSKVLPWLISWIVLAVLYIPSSSQINAFNYFAGSKIRSGLQGVVYDKLLRLPASVNGDEAAGSLVNVIMNDTLQFIFACTAVHYSWSVPAGFIAGWGLLVYSAGIYPALAFLLGLICLVPLIAIFGKIMMTNWDKKMAKSDLRVNKVTEIVQNLKVTKLMAWEQYDANAVQELRNQEVKLLKPLVWGRFGCIFVMNALQIICTLICIATYVCLNDAHAYEIVRITLLTSAICFPLIMGSLMLTFLFQTKSSLRRISAFLKIPELASYTHKFDSDSDLALKIDFDKLVYPKANLKEIMEIGEEKEKPKKKKETEETEETQTADEVEEVAIETASEEFALTDIHLDIKKGQTIAVVGDVGSGKSTLLNGILNELTSTDEYKNSVYIDGTTSYFQQSGVVFNDTVKQNILFGRPLDQEKYDTAVSKCCLKADLEVFPAGENTEIGERGTSISGGQRARIDLARCVYADADIYLLDDPLSAVDAHICKSLIQNVILDALKNKTVILCTHQIQILPFVDNIVMMKNGKIDAVGTYDELKDSISTFEFTKDEEVIQEESENDPEEEEVVADAPKETSSVIESEEQNEGAVSWRTFITYFRYSKLPGLATFIIICELIAAGLSALSSWWVNTKSAKIGSTAAVILSGYSGSVIFSLVATGLSLLGFYILNIRSSKNIHGGMISKILHAPISWVSAQPLGRIQNRFSSDVQDIDVEFTPAIESVTNMGAQLLATIVLICLPTAWLILASVGCIILAGIFLQIYRPIARDLKRCDNVLKSPVLSHTSQTLTGITIMRSFDQVDTFKGTFAEKCNKNTTSTWLVNAASVWESLYTNMSGVILQIIIYVVCCVVSYNNPSNSTGTLVTSLQAVSQLTWILIYMTESVAELEQACNGLERIQHYTNNIPQEDDYKLESDPNSSAWPVNGTINFNNVSGRYRDDLPLVIKDLKLTIEGGQKIGIVGRSGAGKSTLTNLILRIIDSCEGTITIDEVDIKSIGIHTLREAIAVIPQDPLLSSGTLRNALDPGNLSTDLEIWEALSTVQLSDYFKSQSGLESPISPGGSNLSAGQKQLLCLARALIKNSKIICIDEATSSVSYDQDALIQQKIRSEFAQSTILAVAHRINTIIDFDKIIVMDDGQVSEFGSPLELYNSGGLFKALCESANIKPSGL